MAERVGSSFEMVILIFLLAFSTNDQTPKLNHVCLDFTSLVTQVKSLNEINFSVKKNRQPAISFRHPSLSN